MTKQPLRLLDLFRYYRGLPHQMAAIAELERELPPGLLDRSQDWFKTWIQVGKVQEPHWMGVALKVIKDFEGCRLNAYQCDANRWTIGYGITEIHGKPVAKGDRITASQADDLLVDYLQKLHQQLTQLIPTAAHYGSSQTAALLSLAYNVGINAVTSSTLRARINSGENAQIVVREELPRWNKVNGNPSEGLTRRRAAEVKLFAGTAPAVAVQQEPAKLRPSSPFSARITPHITLGEFALGQEARRFRHQHQVDTAAELAAFLERVRKQFGGNPVIITSGYRPPAVNRSVGGASGSEHLYDAPSVGAVDFYVKGADIKTVQDWCDKHWNYSLGYGAPKGFVHLGVRKGRPRVRWDY